MKKVVLGYSGGLDTSVLIKLIKEKYNAEVIAVVVDVGQKENITAIKEKALAIGAVESIVIDARDEFAEHYILPAIKANAVYEKSYPLATALARPLIAKHLVDIAHQYGAETIAHGCTGKGNDQVRFETAIACLDPQIELLAPVREFGLNRDYELAYAKEHDIPIDHQLNIYSIDENLWGRSIECGPLEDADNEPPESAFAWTNSPLKAPNYNAYLEIEFESGKPCRLNGKSMDLANLITELNRIGGLHGVGRIDHIESRIIGLKSREVYETPAAAILLAAHYDLEKMVLTRDVLSFKPFIENLFSELVYDGRWFSPLFQALNQFVNATQETVSGKVKIKLYKGNVIIIGRDSKNSLYQKEFVTYSSFDQFEFQSARGFIEIWSLPYKVVSSITNKKTCNNTHIPLKKMEKSYVKA